MAASSEILLEARGLKKTFGSICAVDGVDFSISAGEIVAIVGDNGAGKSTFVKMLSGALVPDSGELYVDGQLHRLHEPRDGRLLGIETIYQDWALLPNRDVTTNLFLGRELMAGGLGRYLGVLATRRMRTEARRHLQELQIDIPAISGTPIENMSGGQQQSIAIARALSWASRLVIMDEPTAALGIVESAAVLRIVERARAAGTAIIIISHILPHVLSLADRITVMRHGSRVADVTASSITHEDLIALIVGGRLGGPVAG